MTCLRILTKDNPEDNKFLRRKMKRADLTKMDKKEMRDLVQKMRETMIEADGIGLAASQVGIDLRLFVARNDGKFYAIFNPEITKQVGEPIKLEEGCLSVPDYRGNRERHPQIVLEGFNLEGTKVKIKADGLLAHIFQHETDHLNGELYIDKASEVIEN